MQIYPSVDHHMLEKENNTPYYFLPYTTDRKTRGVGGGGSKVALSFFFEPETVSICDFDGSRYHRTLQSQRRLFTPSKFR